MEEETQEIRLVRVEEQMKAVNKSLESLTTQVSNLRQIVVLAYLVPIALFFLQQLF